MKLSKNHKTILISRYTEFKRLMFSEPQCIQHAIQPFQNSILLRETAEKELKKLIGKNQHLINNTTKNTIFDHEFTI